MPGRSHPIFNIVELCIQIIDEVLVSKWSAPVECHATLLAIACISHTSYYIACNALWRELSSLNPLIRLLPENAHSFDTSHGAFITRSLSPRDLSVFDKYASRVRKLKIEKEYFCGGILKLCVWRIPLLPQLRQLSFALSPTSHELLPILLLHPLVESLSFALAARDTELNGPYRDVVRQLPRYFPNLQHLELYTQTDLFVTDKDNLAEATFSGALLQLQRLDSLRLAIGPDVPTPVFCALSSSRTLKKLVMSSLSDSFMDLLPDGDFPVLEVLEVGDAFLPNVLPILVRTTSTTLRKITFRINLMDTFLAPVLDVLAQRHCNTLREVRVEIIEHIGYLNLKMSGSIFRRLLPCHLMESFHVSTRECAVDFEDDDIDAFARSWPNLVKFGVVEWEQPLFHTKVTLYGLATFADHCPRLERLAITVDATATAPFSRPSIPTQNSASRLDSLHLKSHPCSNVDFVVSFLARTFPSLVLLQHCDHEGRSVAGSWDDVRKQLYELRVPGCSPCPPVSPLAG